MIVRGSLDRNDSPDLFLSLAECKWDKSAFSIYIVCITYLVHLTILNICGPAGNCIDALCTHFQQLPSARIRNQAIATAHSGIP